MAERQFGPYRLVRQIAVGGMAEIHLAKTKGVAGFEKYVALKMIHPNFAEDEQFIQMLVDEAKISVQLNHGNIAQTFDLGRVGDTYYITMEYVDGADLYKILRRASETDLEMPLDVAAFIAKEMASALDHAHRKKDHTGRNLGIVHRDVSPQNVLVSYAGEVKLVDFGIAKATSKAKQTAVGVIKGKYYYMSPEQAWGETIDYRSDIFSAGIVLYEMITGQMLYLEEDLHRLLDMVRKADIKPPGTLRKGVPPQLSQIVMRALHRDPKQRYQSASDFAADLERFIHSYSPVFTAAAKVSQFIKQVLGDPEAAPEYDLELGPDSIIPTLDPELVVHERDEVRDENSVIFRVADLKPKRAPNQVTRESQLVDVAPVPTLKPRQPTPPKGAPQARASSPKRMPHEETRQVPLDIKTPVSPSPFDNERTLLGDGELENVADRTMITGEPSGFMMDHAGEEGGEATMISEGPPVEESSESEDGPTIQRDPIRLPKRGAPPPAALAAKIHAPAVSELRKPRQSRKTPAGGNNVLQQIVGNAISEPMPTPKLTPHRNEDSSAQTLPERPAPPIPGRAPTPPAGAPRVQQQTGPAPLVGTPPQGAPLPYGNDASGLPMAMTTPPPGTPMQMVPGVPPHLQPYAMQQGMPQQQYPQQQPPYPPQQPYPQYPQGWGPAGNMYGHQQMNPFGQPPQPMSLTGQMRLMEADEIPSNYKVGKGGRWIALAIGGVAAVSIAAGVTFLIIRASREPAAATTATIHVLSEPPGAEVSYDGQKLVGPTPMLISDVPVGSKHDLKVELARHKAYTQTVEIPKAGGQVEITIALQPITGKLVVNSVPGGADIYVNGQLRGHSPTTLTDIDMSSAKKVELKLKGYQDYEQTLDWPANGEIDIDKKLVK